jgi:hypothetical protein
MTIYPTVLYILQHSITGLKYFGKTTQDIRKYKGSGVHWLRHIKKHGKEHVVTIWVSDPFIDSIIISEFALAFSKDNNIVESELWANLKPENGLDGCVAGTKLGPHSAESKQKISEAGKGKTISAETRQKISEARKGKPNGREGKPSPLKGKPSPKKGIPSGKQQNPAPEVECPYCGKIGNRNMMTRYHFDNCKAKSIIPILP